MNIDLGLGQHLSGQVNVACFVGVGALCLAAFVAALAGVVFDFAAGFAFDSLLFLVLFVAFVLLAGFAFDFVVAAGFALLDFTVLFFLSAALP